MTEDAARDRMFEVHMQNYERNRMYPPNHRKEQIMNPEQLLEEVAAAIKHRCISTTERWHLVYYHDRLCCVPSYENVPPEIILTVFTDYQVRAGFTTEQWNDLKIRVAEFYKELHK